MGCAARPDERPCPIRCYTLPMPEDVVCPICTMSDILDAADHHECATCGHEWPKDSSAGAAGVPGDGQPIVKDANGNVLTDGDAVTLTKDLKVKGSSKTLKAGTKIKSIRLVDPDQNAGHDIDAKADGMGVLIKSRFVKKA